MQEDTVKVQDPDKPGDYLLVSKADYEANRKAAQDESNPDRPPLYLLWEAPHRGASEQVGRLRETPGSQKLADKSATPDKKG